MTSTLTSPPASDQDRTSAPDPTSRRGWLLAGLVVAAVAVLGLVLAVAGGDDDPDPAPTPTTAAAAPASAPAGGDAPEPGPLVYGSPDAAERWLAEEPPARVHDYGSADAAERSLTSTTVAATP